MLKIEGLTAIRGKKTVLDGLDLHVEKGSFTVLVGRNGCGKSTLAACIGGTVPYTGSLRLENTELNAMSHRLRAQRVCVLPQHLKAPHITVYELAMMGRNAHIPMGGSPTEEDEQAVRDAILAVGAKEMADRTLDRLSGGERQKAYLAMMLASGTDLLVLDEPTTYTDMSFASEFCTLLASLKEKKTVLAVMHDLNCALFHADSIAVMDGGRIIAHEKTDDLLKTDIIERTFGLKKHTTEIGRVFFA